MRILVEGLDLAGKSTVSNRFIEQAQGSWVLRRNSLVDKNPVYELADELRKGGGLADEPLGWLYLAAMQADFAFLECRHADHDILQDSTILFRSVAHHIVRGRAELARQFLALVPALPHFDYAFVCVADRETRLRRLAKRRRENLSEEDFLVRDDYELFRRMEEQIIDMVTTHLGGIVIDTSNLETEVRLSMIFDHLPRLERQA